MKLVFENRDHYEAFVRTDSKFKGKKFELGQIFDQQRQLDLTVKKVIIDTTFHNLPTAAEMYRNTFKIRFPKHEDMFRYVLTRHDLVHRNGKTKEGIDVVISDSDLEMLIDDTKGFVNAIAIELKIDIEKIQ